MTAPGTGLPRQRHRWRSGLSPPAAPGGAPGPAAPPGRAPFPAPRGLCTASTGAPQCRGSRHACPGRSGPCPTPGHKVLSVFYPARPVPGGSRWPGRAVGPPAVLSAPSRAVLPVAAGLGQRPAGPTGAARGGGRPGRVQYWWARAQHRTASRPSRRPGGSGAAAAAARAAPWELRGAHRGSAAGTGRHGDGCPGNAAECAPTPPSRPPRSARPRHRPGPPAPRRRRRQWARRHRAPLKRATRGCPPVLGPGPGPGLCPFPARGRGGRAAGSPREYRDR